MEKVPVSSENLPAPGVGIGVFVLKGKQVLMGRRLTSVGQNTYSVPGSHLEFEESFEECAAREVKEETGLDVEKIEFLEVRNGFILNETKFQYSCVQLWQTTIRFRKMLNQKCVMAGIGMTGKTFPAHSLVHWRIMCKVVLSLIEIREMCFLKGF